MKIETKCLHPKENTKFFYNKTFRGVYQFVLKCMLCKKTLEILDEDGKQLQESNFD